MKRSKSRNRSKSPASVGEEQEYMDELFNQAQLNSTAQDRLCQKMNDILSRMCVKEFWKDFYQMFALTFVNFDRSKFEERAVNFVVKFLLNCSLANSDEVYVDTQIVRERDMENEYLNIKQKGLIVLHRFIMFCIEHHNAAEFKVRFRCIHYLRLLLDGMAADATLSEETFCKISEVLLKRVWDKKAIIRSESVLGLQRLQNPTSRDCQVVKCLLYLMRNDESPDVRIAAVNAIALTSRTLDSVLANTRDINHRVRCHAYKKLTEQRSVINSLSIAKRVQTLKDGLSDTSKDVISVCVELLKAWHSFLQKKTIDLLKKFDVEGEATVTALALTHLLEKLDPEDIESVFEELQNILCPESLCPKEEFWCGEAAMLWHVMCSYTKDKGMTNRLEKILPTAMNYYSYLSRLHTVFVNFCTNKMISETMETEACVAQSLLVLPFVDLSDSFGRNKIRELLRKYLICDKLPVTVIKSLMEAYAIVEARMLVMCDAVIEMITEIRDPMEEEENNISVAEINPAERSRVSIDCGLQGVSSNLIRKLSSASPGLKKSLNKPLRQEEDLDHNTRFQLSKMQAEMIIAKGELEECIAQMKFEEAAVVHQKMISIQNQRRELLIQKGVLPATEPCAEEDPSMVEFSRSILAAQNASMINTRISNKANDTILEDMDVLEKSDPATLLRCVTIAVELFNVQPKLWKVTPGMRSLMESLILPAIQCTSDNVRRKAVVAMGLWCSVDKGIAQQYMNLLNKILKMDIVDIRVLALGGIIDCFLIYGLTDFENINKSTHINLSSSINDCSILLETKSSSVKEVQGSTNLLDEIVALIQSPEPSLKYTALRGLAKLILFRRISSPKLLIQLLLAYFNPKTESEDEDLYILLAHFFPKLVHCSVTVDDILGHTSVGFDPTLPDRRKKAMEIVEEQRKFALENQKSLAQIFVLTLNEIINAPGDSQMFKVDPWNVAKLLLRLTDSTMMTTDKKAMESLVGRNVMRPEAENSDGEGDHPDASVQCLSVGEENPCHDEIALMVAKEILRAPLSPGVKVYIRILNNVRLSNKCDLIKQLLTLFEKIMHCIEDRNLLKPLRSLSKILRSCLQTLDASVSPSDTCNGDMLTMALNMTTPVTESRRSCSSQMNDDNITTPSAVIKPAIEISGNLNGGFFLGSRIGGKNFGENTIMSKSQTPKRNAKKPIGKKAKETVEEPIEVPDNSDIESVDENIKVRTSIGRRTTVSERPRFSRGRISETSSADSSIRKSARLSAQASISRGKK